MARKLKTCHLHRCFVDRGSYQEIDVAVLKISYRLVQCNMGEASAFFRFFTQRDIGSILPAIHHIDFLTVDLICRTGAVE